MAVRGRNPQLLGVVYFIVVAGYCCAERDTLFQGQELKDGEHLVSTYGKFRLGFQSQYLGIWYSIPSGAESWFYGDKSNQRYQKLVWVASLVPIWDKSGILSIGTDGNLNIDHSGGGDPIVFTSARVGSSNTSATLHDDGNFVLNELNNDGSVRRLLWQSFDYPTDTFLPGMKPGVNLQTGHRWFLTSWQNPKVLATGSFTFGLDPNGTKELMVFWEREAYWHAFSVSDELFSKFHFQYIENENETYFIYSVFGDEQLSFPAIIIDNFGSLSGFTETMVSCCDFCEKVSPGCVPEAIPSCSREKLNNHESRVSISRTPLSIYWGDVRVVDKGYAPNSTRQSDYNDCRRNCLRNCSCTTYSFYLDETMSACSTWSLNVTQSSLGASTSKKRLVGLFIGLGVGGAVLICLSCFGLWIYKHPDVILDRVRIQLMALITVMTMAWRRCREGGSQIISSIMVTNSEQEILLCELGIDEMHNHGHGGRRNQELQFFSLETVKMATENFVTQNKLGEGGFGSVYKGKLPGGQEIAIKRLSTNSRQGMVEFKNEVKVIAKLQHNNLVRLVGCCLEKGEKILIYEYMPNKSLDFFLFDEANQRELNWGRRFKIMEGVAQGLLYLHKYSRLKIIHRDLKAGNILLDSEMNPKISDFGMAKIFGADESKANTNRVVGTYGYMPPEYAIEGIFSTKSDVFSFGVLLLEIVTGRRNNSFHHSDGPLSLIVYAWEIWTLDRAVELIDPTIEEGHHKEVIRCVHIGLLCVQENPADRPNMLDVASMLYNEATELPSPNQPAFYYRKNLQGLNFAGYSPGNCSQNEVTITELEAR